LPAALEKIVALTYVLTWIIYLAKDIYFARGHGISIPKQLVVFGTALSWYVGIVAFNGDMPFTIINVVSHGLPYIGLIWIFGLKKQKKQANKTLFSKLAFVPVFLGLLLILAYVEEGLWAGLVWREHLEVFGWFANLPQVIDHSTLAWVVPLLSLPQVTHYILDGFIWKLRDPNVGWQKTVFEGESQST
jgi:membrane protease YdiL (CAAX protease family)